MLFASDKFYKFIEAQKNDILRMGGYEADETTGRLPFEKMKKGEMNSKQWFPFILANIMFRGLLVSRPESLETMLPFGTELRQILSDKE